MKRNKCVVILVSLVMLLGLVLSTQAMAGETYKLGCSLAITGPTSDIGSPYSKGVEERALLISEATRGAGAKHHGSFVHPPIVAG